MNKYDKKTLNKLFLIGMILGILFSIIYFTCIFVAYSIQAEEWVKTLIVILGAIPYFIGITYGLKIEQKLNSCKENGLDSPSFSDIFFATRINRKRYRKY